MANRPPQRPFDRHPLTSENIGELAGVACGMLVVGHRRAIDGWQVLVLVNGPDRGIEAGQLVRVTLSSAAARVLARDLTSMADLCERGWKC